MWKPPPDTQWHAGIDARLRRAAGTGSWCLSGGAVFVPRVCGRAATDWLW